MKTVLLTLTALLLFNFSDAQNFSANNMTNDLQRFENPNLLEKNLERVLKKYKQNEKDSTQFLYNKNLGTLNVYTDLYTPQELVENIFAFGCIELNNITYTGHPDAIGYFNNAAHIIGIEDGIILSTGRVADAIGPNNSGNTSTNFHMPGDEDLNNLLSQSTTYDAAVIEFDFIPGSFEIAIQYVLASEDYPEYAGSSYSDIFAVFLSGGPENYNNTIISTIPGASRPVQINTVHSSSFSQYYISNWDPATYNFEYDGFTTVFTTFAQVSPGQAYNIKIAIADVADGVLDSALFLKAGSLPNSTESMLFTLNYDTEQVLHHSENSLVIYRGNLSPISNPVEINIEYSGSAIMGIDYSYMPETIIIPAFHDSIVLNFDVFMPCEAEGNIIFNFENSQCIINASPVGAVKEYIVMPSKLGSVIEIISYPDCEDNNGVAFINAINGIEPYSYVWNDENQSNSQLCESLESGIVNVTTTDAVGCTSVAEIFMQSNSIVVQSVELLSNATCYLAEDGIILITLWENPPYSIEWSDGLEFDAVNNITDENYSIENLSTGTYSLSITDINNCAYFTEIVISQPDPAICIEDFGVELYSEGIILDELVYPQGGLFTLNGEEIAIFYPPVYGIGNYEIDYELIDDYDCNYSCNFSITVFETDSLPIVVTHPISSISSFSAVGNGIVTYNGGAEIISRGFVWSTIEYPTLNASEGSISSGYGLGEFQANITNLQSETDYYIRAFAENSYGVSYGDQVLFTTLSDNETDIILMCDSIITTCYGLFYDSGGHDSNYQNNEDYTISFYPADANTAIGISFSSFDTETNFDWLRIYSGPDIYGDLLVEYSGYINNPSTYYSNHNSGALTVTFNSDASVTREGWSAEIFCFDTIQCQDYTISISESQPEAYSLDSLWISTCIGEEVSFVADAFFPNNNYNYYQNISNLNCRWIVYSENCFNVYEGIGMNNFNHTFNQSGLYYVYLETFDVKNCYSSISQTYKIMVTGNPIFADFSVSNSVICVNDEINLVAELQTYTFESQLITSFQTNSCIADQFTLEKCFIFDSFEYGQTISSANDLKLILDMEHSFLGELEISLRCPNGTTVIIHEFIDLFDPDNCSDTKLGIPIETNNCIIGTCWEYEFDSSAPNTIRDVCQEHNTLPSGVYAPHQSFEDLIGCPLNGEWCVIIADNYGNDDGTLCSVEFVFHDDIIPATVEFEYEYSSINWQGENIVFNENGLATAIPTTEGLLEYTLEITDLCGNIYESNLHIYVNSNLTDFSIVANGSTEILEGDSVNISAPYYEQANYIWTINGDDLGINSHSITVYEQGEYSLTIINSCNSSVSTNSINIIVNDAAVCQENIFVCKDYGQIILNGEHPAGGTYYLDGNIISDFNTFDYESGHYEINYIYDYGCCITDCSFYIIIVDLPAQVEIAAIPEDGVLGVEMEGEILINNSETGVYYWVSVDGVDITTGIQGNGGIISLGSNFLAGNYEVLAKNLLNCTKSLGTIDFINESINKIIAVPTYGNPQISFSAESVKVILYKEIYNPNPEIVIFEEKLIDGNQQCDFNELQDGKYFIGSYILFPSDYPNVSSHIFYQNAFIHENAIEIILENSTEYLAEINHPVFNDILGTNSGGGTVGLIDNEKNIELLSEMIVVLKDSNTNDILDISISDNDGEYSFEIIPDNTLIEIFATSLLYPYYIPYQTNTGEYEFYEVDFIVEDSLIYPSNYHINSGVISNLDFNVYPNPADNFIILKNIPDNSVVSIFDVKERLILKETIHNNSYLNISDFNSGLYYIIIVCQNGKIGIQKLIKI